MVMISRCWMSFILSRVKTAGRIELSLYRFEDTASFSTVKSIGRGEICENEHDH